MYINYRAVQLPVSKLLFAKEEGHRAVHPPVHEGGQTYWVLKQGFQGGRSGDKRRVLCYKGSLSSHRIKVSGAVYTDHSYCHFRHPADEGRHHLFIFKELGNY